MKELRIIIQSIGLKSGNSQIIQDPSHELETKYLSLISKHEI